ncbi:MAG: hypothetical protein EOP82_28605 [Variovorax sp.]|nr:MAG: hypothetical protein EOP82_28605 [Variovorax sp.]
MRFVILHQAGPHGAAGPFPPAANGLTLHEHVALQPGTAAVRIDFPGGTPRHVAGAFDGTRQLAGLGIIEADSRQAAIAWLQASPAIDAEFEIRETGCAGGLPGVDLSTGATKPRFLILVKADAATEAEAPSDAGRLAAMAKRNDEGVKAGMLLAGDGLRSTASGTRVKFAGGKTRVLDGPFAEAKELVAGYWLVQADSLDDAIAWVHRYPYAQERPEVEIRPVSG